MRPSNIDLAEKHLYDDKNVMQAAGLTVDQIQAVIRIRDVYTTMMEYPSKKEREIVDHLIQFYGIKKSQAYKDLKAVKMLIGNLEQSSRQWHLWRFNKRNEETRELARKLKDTKAMARCDHDYAKFNRVNEDEVDPVDWSTVQVQPFFPTSDPRSIGIEPVPNIMEKIRSLEKKYFAEIDAVDTDYEEISFNPDDIYKTDQELEDEKWQ